MLFAWQSCFDCFFFENYPAESDADGLIKRTNFFECLLPEWCRPNFLMFNFPKTTVPTLKKIEINQREMSSPLKKCVTCIFDRKQLCTW